MVGESKVKAFSRSLEQLPVWLPTGHSILRASLDRWLIEQELEPHVVGECGGSAPATFSGTAESAP